MQIYIYKHNVEQFDNPHYVKLTNQSLFITIFQEAYQHIIYTYTQIHQTS